MTKLETLAYFSKVAREQILNPDTGLGHLYASVLSVQHPQLHDQIIGDASLDPYLTDDNIPAFLQWFAEQGE